MPRTQTLYRFFDSTGALLYVGITATPGARWKKHAADKSWWTDVTTATVEHHPTREAVEAAERQAIRTEYPRHNVVHNLSGPVRLAPPESADAMPDDCHEHCARVGVLSAYLPHRWAKGVAHYHCNRGHAWSTPWGELVASGPGVAPEHYGRPIAQTLIPVEETR